MTTHDEIESVTPMSDRPHPRQEAKEAIRRKRLAKPSGPIVNQHTSEVAPRMDVDEILKKSFKDIGK